MTETDRDETLAAGPADERHRVPILQPAAAFAARQLDDLVGTVLGQAGTRAGLGARHRAGGDELAVAQVAAVAGLVRDQLRDGPEEIGGAGPGDAVSR